MNCEKARDRMLAALGTAGGLDALEDEVERHVESCEDCSAERRFLVSLCAAMRRASAAKAPPDLRRRVREGASRLLAEEEARAWADLGRWERVRATLAYFADRARRSRIAAAAAVLLLAQAALVGISWLQDRTADRAPPARPGLHARSPESAGEPRRAPAEPASSEGSSGSPGSALADGPGVEPPDEPLRIDGIGEEDTLLAEAETGPPPVSEIRRLGLENRRQRIRYRMRGRFLPPEDSPSARAVHRAHRFLVALQREDGAVDPTYAGGGKEGTTAATALAVLAWLSDARSGRPGGVHARAVERSVRYLRRQVRPDRQVGWVRGDSELELFQHAAATAALVEYAVLTDRLSDPLAADVLERLVDLARSRQTSDGAGPDVVGSWVAFALELGRSSGLEVPFDLDAPAAAVRRSLLAERPPGALGLGPLLGRECDAALDALGGRRRESVRRDPGGLLAFLRRASLREPTLVLFTTLDLHARGGPLFERWRQELEGVLLESQRDDGSWPLEFVWDDVQVALGDVYPTAVFSMALQVPRRWSR